LPLVFLPPFFGGNNQGADALFLGSLLPVCHLRRRGSAPSRVSGCRGSRWAGQRMHVLTSIEEGLVLSGAPAFGFP